MLLLLMGASGAVVATGTASSTALVGDYVISETLTGDYVVSETLVGDYG